MNMGLQDNFEERTSVSRLYDSIALTMTENWMHDINVVDICLLQSV